MCSTTDLFLGQQGEPALDLIQPGGGGRRKVYVKARMAREPGAHRGGFVGSVVVHDQMHIQGGGNRRLNGPQELQKFLAAMAPMQLADHLAGGDIQCGKQRGRTMAQVVVRAPLGNPGRQRQDRLGAIQRLNLALLVDTQHHRLDRWIDVQADDIARLRHKQRIGGEFESL